LDQITERKTTIRHRDFEQSEEQPNPNRNPEEDEDIEKLRAKGIKIHVISSEERKLWAGKLRPYLEKEISLMGDFGGKIMRIANEVNVGNPY